MIIIVALIWILVSACNGLKVYQSLLSPDSTSGVAGLKFIGPILNTEFSSSVTICGRFNFRRLQQSALFDFTNENERLMFLQIRYPTTWFQFGNPLNGPNSFASWVLQDPKTKDYSIFFASKWHHLCISYDSNDGNSKIILSLVKMKAFYFCLLNHVIEVL